MMSILRYQTFFKWAFIISLLVMLVTYTYKDLFPNPKEYRPYHLTPPLQTPTDKAPFHITTHEQTYLVSPKFEYELTGVVVSYNDAAQFTNIWHHRRWKDFINVRDICVIWEPNVSSGIYKYMMFSSDSWTCWAAWDRNQADQFNPTALSNNHLITENPALQTQLLKAERGDVIHLKGFLADYKNEATGGLRKTSIKRDDDGQGACETIYLSSFSILKKANSSLRLIYKLSLWITIFSFIGLGFCFIMAPFKPR